MSRHLQHSYIQWISVPNQVLIHHIHKSPSHCACILPRNDSFPSNFERKMNKLKKEIFFSNLQNELVKFMNVIKMLKLEVIFLDGNVLIVLPQSVLNNMFFIILNNLVKSLSVRKEQVWRFAVCSLLNHLNQKFWLSRIMRLSFSRPHSYCCPF